MLRIQVKKYDIFKNIKIKIGDQSAPNCWFNLQLSLYRSIQDCHMGWITCSLLVHLEYILYHHLQQHFSSLIPKTFWYSMAERTSELNSAKRGGWQTLPHTLRYRLSVLYSFSCLNAQLESLILFPSDRSSSFCLWNTLIHSEHMDRLCFKALLFSMFDGAWQRTSDYLFRLYSARRYISQQTHWHMSIHYICVSEERTHRKYDSGGSMTAGVQA